MSTKTCVTGNNLILHKALGGEEGEITQNHQMGYSKGSQGEGSGGAIYGSGVISGKQGWIKEPLETHSVSPQALPGVRPVAMVQHDRHP